MTVSWPLLPPSFGNGEVLPEMGQSWEQKLSDDRFSKPEKEKENESSQCDWKQLLTSDKTLEGRKLWLLKCEPDVFGWEDLAKAPWENWDGVRNHQAKNMLKKMREGDLAIFYHSNATPSGCYGAMQIVREWYWDVTQFDSDEKYYDKRVSRTKPTWVQCDFQALCKFDTYVSLPMMREMAELKEMKMLKKGARLSVVALEEEEWRAIIATGLEDSEPQEEPIGSDDDSLICPKLGKRVAETCDPGNAKRISTNNTT